MFVIYSVNFLLSESISSFRDEAVLGKRKTNLLFSCPEGFGPLLLQASVTVLSSHPRVRKSQVPNWLRDLNKSRLQPAV